MYIRIVEITAPTKLQLNIFLDYLRFTHFPKNLEQGQTSAKVFRVNAGRIVSVNNCVASSNMPCTGKNVDVVIIDDNGTMQSHPEFAVNQPISTEKIQAGYGRIY